MQENGQLTCIRSFARPDLQWALSSRLWLSFDACLHPPRRSVMAGKRVGGCIEASQFMRETWTVNTPGIILALGHFATSCKTEQTRARAKAMLSLWSAVVVDWSEADSAFDNALHQLGEPCTHVGDEVCRHLEKVLAYVSGLEVSPSVAFAEVVVGCIKVINVCPSIGEFMKSICMFLAEHVHNRVDETEVADPLSVGSRAKAGGRRRSHHEAFKHEIREGIIKKQKAVTGAHAAALHNVDERRAREWQESFLVRSLAANFRAFGELKGTFCICQDAASLGKPAKDTTVYCAWHPGTGVGTWLANQALAV